MSSCSDPITDYPMTTEATIAMLTGDRALSMVAAFTQACHAQVKWQLCPWWRRRRRRLLERVTRRRWLIALTIRDSIGRADGRRCVPMAETELEIGRYMRMPEPEVPDGS